MLITTIIAHYNYQKYLPHAIDSALKQNYGNICIIDDCSDDQYNLSDIVFEKGEIEFVGSYGDIATVISSPRKTLINLYQNGGPSRARNIGIKYFWDVSDAFMILDADDQMLGGKISRFSEEMEKDINNIGVVYGDYYIYDEITGVINQEFKKPYDKRLLTYECIVHSNALINKKALEVCGLYDESLRVAEDFDLWKRISNRFMINHVPEFLSLVVNHPNNSTYSVPKEIWNQCHYKVMSK